MLTVDAEPNEGCVVEEVELHPGVQRREGFRFGYLLDRRSNFGSGASIPSGHEVRMTASPDQPHCQGSER